MIYAYSSEITFSLSYCSSMAIHKFHSFAQFFFFFQVPVVPLQRPDEMQIPNPSWMQTSAYEDMSCELGIPTMFTWSYGGKDVAVEGSWDDWKTRFQEKKKSLDYLFSVRCTDSFPSSYVHLVFQVGLTEIREGLYYYESTAIRCLPV